MALARAEVADSAAQEKALHRGVAWLVSMQNGDGGWGAFDHDNNLQPAQPHTFRRSQRHARSFHRRRHRAGHRMPGANGLGVYEPVIRRGSEFYSRGSMRGRLVVRPLGSELRLRNQRRACAPWKHWRRNLQPECARERRNGCAGAESGRRIRRNDRILRRSIAQGQGREHRFANRVGLDRVAGCVRSGRSVGASAR